VTGPLERIYIIGTGEVGRRLSQALRTSGSEVIEVTRCEGWDHATHDPDGVRLVCVREEDLAMVLDRLAGVPDRSIICIQNGWIRPVLSGMPHVTRGLVWFTSKGDFFEILRPSPFYGPFADNLTSRLTAGGILATSVDNAEFAALEADKMGFNCVVGLPLAVHGVTLQTYLADYDDEARELFEESVTTCAHALGAATDPGWWREFCVATQPLGWIRTTAAKALEFRNGAVARLAREHGISVPVTDRLLNEVGLDPTR
jgi:ketopantoate reductase